MNKTMNSQHHSNPSHSSPQLDKKQHRIKFNGKINYEFQNYRNIFPDISDSVIDGLKEDCSKAFSYRNKGDDDEDDDTASIHSTDYHNDGCTFFYRANESPRCGLEALVSRVFHMHTKDADYDPSNSGAEWWTQVVNCEDDIGFHWDKDYAYEQNTGVNLYPHLGTVTYLTDTGGPTLVLKRPGCRNSADDHAGPVPSIVVSKPTFGKHIKFDGKLLHAAPAGLCAQKSNSSDSKSPVMRITFLVNIWLNHIPIRSLSCPDELVKTFVTPVACLSERKGAPTTTTPVKVPSLPLLKYKKGQPLPLDLHSWKFNNGGMKYAVYVPLPASERLVSMAKHNDAFTFAYPGNGVEAKVELVQGLDPAVVNNDVRISVGSKRDFNEIEEECQDCCAHQDECPIGYHSEKQSRRGYMWKPFHRRLLV